MMEKEINGKKYVVVQKEAWELIIAILLKIDEICDKYEKESNFRPNSMIYICEGKELDFSGEWERINYIEKLTEILGFDFLNETDIDEYKNKVIAKGFFKESDMAEYKSIPQLTDFLYKKLLRANITGPVIMYNYPASLKPLARRNDSNPLTVDCFQVVVCGSEMCNAYSELVNPETQRSSFEEQLKAKEAGDDETMDMDEEYLLAMEQGMPPISGLGFGIERLIMIAFDCPSVRDVTLFPTMKQNKTGE